MECPHCKHDRDPQSPFCTVCGFDGQDAHGVVTYTDGTLLKLERFEVDGHTIKVAKALEMIESITNGNGKIVFQKEYDDHVHPQAF